MHLLSGQCPPGFCPLLMNWCSTKMFAFFLHYKFIILRTAKHMNSFDLFFATFTGTGEPKSDSPTVSIWRTYFVANEWNKIQTLRQISPTFQIIAVLFFLEVPVTETLLCLWVAPFFLIADMLPSDVEVLGFSDYALSEPVSTAERSPQAFTPPYSMTLRYGLASILWLCLGLLQVHRHHSDCSKTSFSVFFNWSQNWKREDKWVWSGRYFLQNALLCGYRWFTSLFTSALWKITSINLSTFAPSVT